MTPQEYEAKRQARYERLKAAAASARAEAAQLSGQARSMASVIPLGQPILVGHHSERGDRAYRAKIGRKHEKAAEATDRAADLEQRAAAMLHNRAIFSDDPAAAEKIADKIARLEERQKLMTTANRLVRKKDRAGLLELGFSESQVDSLFTPDFCGRLGFPDYALTNNGANIRRLKARLTTVEAAAQRETKERDLHGVTVTENAEENRLQLTFPGKPAEAVRADLKAHGFRWSPTAGVWQRQLNNSAAWAAQSIITKHYAPKEA